MKNTFGLSAGFFVIIGSVSAYTLPSHADELLLKKRMGKFSALRIESSSTDQSYGNITYEPKTGIFTLKDAQDNLQAMAYSKIDQADPLNYQLSIYDTDEKLLSLIKTPIDAKEDPIYQILTPGTAPEEDQQLVAKFNDHFNKKQMSIFTGDTETPLVLVESTDAAKAHSDSHLPQQTEQEETAWKITYAEQNLSLDKRIPLLLAAWVSESIPSDLAQTEVVQKTASTLGLSSLSPYHALAPLALLGLYTQRHRIHPAKEPFVEPLDTSGTVDFSSTDRPEELDRAASVVSPAKTTTPTRHFQEVGRTSTGRVPLESLDSPVVAPVPYTSTLSPLKEAEKGTEGPIKFENTPIVNAGTPSSSVNTFGLTEAATAAALHFAGPAALVAQSFYSAASSAVSSHRGSVVGTPVTTHSDTQFAATSSKGSPVQPASARISGQSTTGPRRASLAQPASARASSQSTTGPRRASLVQPAGQPTEPSSRRSVSIQSTHQPLITGGVGTITEHPLEVGEPLIEPLDSTESHELSPVISRQSTPPLNENTQGFIGLGETSSLAERRSSGRHVGITIVTPSKAHTVDESVESGDDTSDEGGYEPSSMVSFNAETNPALTSEDVAQIETLFSQLRANIQAFKEIMNKNVDLQSLDALSPISKTNDAILNSIRDLINRVSSDTQEGTQGLWMSANLNRVLCSETEQNSYLHYLRTLNQCTTDLLRNNHLNWKVVGFLNPIIHKQLKTTELNTLRSRFLGLENNLGVLENELELFYRSIGSTQATSTPKSSPVATPRSAALAALRLFAGPAAIMAESAYSAASSAVSSHRNSVVGTPVSNRSNHQSTASSPRGSVSQSATASRRPSIIQPSSATTPSNPSTAASPRGSVSATLQQVLAGNLVGAGFNLLTAGAQSLLSPNAASQTVDTVVEGTSPEAEDEDTLPSANSSLQ